MIHLFKRLIPQSVARQIQEVEEPEKPVIQEPQYPEDMPTVDEWFRIRVWADEIEGRSLTN